MIPYYSPNLSLIRIIKAFFQRKAESKVVRYFQELSGKKYVLITNSCRTALYLAYRAVGNSGEVLVSPLTCKTAIDPITESDYHPIFCDIRLDNLTMDTDDIAARVTNKTIAIQVIHFGGVACEMNTILELAKKYYLYIIEDCAQALGAKYKNSYCGRFGDIACFSLIKNGYGIGGGIFATNNQIFYERAIAINNQFRQADKSLLFFRLFRNYLESRRRYAPFNYLYTLIMQWRRRSNSYMGEKTIISQLAKVSKLEIKLFAAQLKRLGNLHQKRQRVGLRLYQEMKENNLMLNMISNGSGCSFVKFFAYHPNFKVPDVIQQLDHLGIEAKHLEHKYKVFYQEKLISEHLTRHDNQLKNYFQVHDHLMSLPLCEYFGDNEINLLVYELQKILKFAPETN